MGQPDPHPGYPTPHGPFRADQVREGDPYEISQGHPIRCLPTGGRGSAAARAGVAALSTDPAVESAGVETGFTPSPDTLRAPDVAVGNVPDKPGWVAGVPPLAVEYADTGQDEKDLAVKIRELLDAGTRFLWVVRLTGPRRVEIHEAGQPVRTAWPGEVLEAPGILQNRVPVEALYDWRVSQDVALRNLLQRKGYADLDAVLNKGKVEGQLVTARALLLAVFAARGLEVSAAVRDAVSGCDDIATLTRWHLRAVSAASADEAVGG